MENLKIVNSNTYEYGRFYGDTDSEIIGVRGTRYGDLLEIVPMQGQRKRVVLNRTKFTIELSCFKSCRVSGSEIEFNAPAGTSAKFEIVLCGKNGASNVTEESGRYLIRAIGSIPFRVNGSYSYESFIERGDNIHIGYNKLLFKGEALLTSDKDIASHEILSKSDLLQSKLNILIEGETGTGKSYLAKKIHESSGRAGRFVHINLSSFSENLVESELFGHVKGAYTGAITAKQGAFLCANRGTLFLDEIDSLSKALQVKLLLFLDSKEIRPVGGNDVVKTDVRVIFASGSSLERLVERGDMRKDFFYRISSEVRIKTEPLAANKDLIASMCIKFSMDHDVVINSTLIKFYQGLSWPGNIRQLLGHLEKKLVGSKSRKFQYDDLDDSLVKQDRFAVLPTNDFISLRSMKKSYVVRVFNWCDGNLSKASDILGVSRSSLRSMLKDESAE